MGRLFDRPRSLLARAATAALALAVAASACASSAEDHNDGAAGADAKSLAGQLLVAAPGMPDPRFARTVIFMVRHGSDGAMGLVVNRVLGVGSAARLLEGAGIGAKDVDGDAKVRVHYGGPVAPGRGFVLHSGEYAEDNTVAVTDKVSMTSAVKVLTAIAKGKGPNQGFLAVGYAGWAAGQLDSEIQGNGWLHAPADNDLVFGEDDDSKWERAVAKVGIDLSLLSSHSGHA